MLGRLKRRGFTEAERVGAQKGKTIVRAYHPVSGWMYEKLAEDDDAAVDAWAARASVPGVNPRGLLGAVKHDDAG
jgi:hypothetical protein